MLFCIFLDHDDTALWLCGSDFFKQSRADFERHAHALDPRERSKGARFEGTLDWAIENRTEWFSKVGLPIHSVAPKEWGGAQSDLVRDC